MNARVVRTRPRAHKDALVCAQLDVNGRKSLGVQHHVTTNVRHGRFGLAHQMLRHERQRVPGACLCCVVHQLVDRVRQPVLLDILGDARHLLYFVEQFFKYYETTTTNHPVRGGLHDLLVRGQQY